MEFSRVSVSSSSLGAWGEVLSMGSPCLPLPPPAAPPPRLLLLLGDTLGLALVIEGHDDDDDDKDAEQDSGDDAHHHHRSRDQVHLAHLVVCGDTRGVGRQGERG